MVKCDMCDRPASWAQFKLFSSGVYEGQKLLRVCDKCMVDYSRYPYKYLICASCMCFIALIAQFIIVYSK